MAPAAPAPAFLVQRSAGQVKLKGRTALITGSSSGIGAAVACHFAAAGADTIVINCPGPRQRAEADAVARRVTESGARGHVIEADVSDAAAVARLVDEANAFCGPIDIVVNNAGIGHADPVETMPIETETWDRVLAVHLRGTFLVTRAVLPLMYARDYGRIINTASQLAYKGAPGVSAYTAAKAGIIGFTRSLAHEIGARNVRVNCVAPGATDTPILADVPPDVLEMVRAGIPVGRIATVEQIAPSYVFLASPDGDHYQGQCISPNGGDMLL